MRTSIARMGLCRDQLFRADGEMYFAPHYESDQFTSAELRLIAAHMDALAAGARSDETNEDLAQSEGRQSGAKRNAHD